jgi:hypothetical protein
MARLRKLLVWALAGSFVGAITATFFAPRFLEWWNTPVNAAALCDCKELVRSTAQVFIWAQAAGAASGAIFFLLVGSLIHRPSPTSVPEVIS